jgi:hypothetical protein
MVNYFETVFIVTYDMINITKYSKLDNILVNGIVNCEKYLYVYRETLTVMYTEKEIKNHINQSI